MPTDGEWPRAGRGQQLLQIPLPLAEERVLERDCVAQPRGWGLTGQMRWYLKYARLVPQPLDTGQGGRDQRPGQLPRGRSPGQPCYCPRRDLVPLWGDTARSSVQCARRTVVAQQGEVKNAGLAPIPKVLLHSQRGGAQAAGDTERHLAASPGGCHVLLFSLTWET